MRTSTYLLSLTTEDAEALADSIGLICFFSKSDELQLDWDSPVDMNLIARVERSLATESICILSECLTVSKSGKCHRYIKLNVELDDAQRVALQACLGSDPVREALSIIRIQNGSEVISCLFETIEEATKVRKWRGL